MGDGVATAGGARSATVVGTELVRDCQGLRADVDWLTGALGRGPMGARFRRRYDAGWVELARSIDAGQRRTLVLTGASVDPSAGG